MRDLADLPLAQRPLRVLVTSYRSNPHVGGQGIYVHELTRALKAAGCNVSVASGPPYPVLDTGIELIRLPSLDLFTVDNAMLALRWHHLRNRADRAEWLAHNTGAFGEMTAFALRLEDFIAREGHRFDIIHDNQTLAMPMARIAQSVPVVTTLHHPIAIDREFAIAGAHTRLGKALSWRWHSFVNEQAKAARALTHFVAVSDAARQSYAERTGMDSSGVRVAYNGIDHTSFTPDPSVPRENGLIVASASADVPIKGLDVLIAALARLKDTHSRARLTVIGSLREGPTKRMLETTGLSDRVRFVSGLTREEIADLHRRATVFVSASRFEGFGFPPAEAMACGAPVIVSKGGALPEVAGDAGIVTPVGDDAALAAALARVLDDSALRRTMSQAGLNRVRTLFRWDLHAGISIGLYRDVLGLSDAGVRAA
ncbi:MAG: Glycosyltransferase [Oceanicaulis sp. HLUCCA04]|nr:MAG: Glycosyltransferase [Oceanicaulis sp. HLUCCA04]